MPAPRAGLRGQASPTPWMTFLAHGHRNPRPGCTSLRCSRRVQAEDSDRHHIGGECATLNHVDRSSHGPVELRPLTKSQRPQHPTRKRSMRTPAEATRPGLACGSTPQTTEPPTPSPIAMRDLAFSDRLVGGDGGALFGGTMSAATGDEGWMGSGGGDFGCGGSSMLPPPLVGWIASATTTAKASESMRSWWHRAPSCRRRLPYARSTRGEPPVVRPLNLPVRDGAARNGKRSVEIRLEYRRRTTVASGQTGGASHSSSSASGVASALASRVMLTIVPIAAPATPSSRQQTTAPCPELSSELLASSSSVRRQAWREAVPFRARTATAAACDVFVASERRYSRDRRNHHRRRPPATTRRRSRDIHLPRRRRRAGGKREGIERSAGETCSPAAKEGPAEHDVHVPVAVDVDPSRRANVRGGARGQESEAPERGERLAPRTSRQYQTPFFGPETDGSVDGIVNGLVAFAKSWGDAHSRVAHSWMSAAPSATKRKVGGAARATEPLSGASARVDGGVTAAARVGSLRPASRASPPSLRGALDGGGSCRWPGRHPETKATRHIARRLDDRERTSPVERIKDPGSGSVREVARPRGARSRSRGCGRRGRCSCLGSRSVIGGVRGQIEENAAPPDRAGVVWFDARQPMRTQVGSRIEHPSSITLVHRGRCRPLTIARCDRHRSTLRTVGADDRLGTPLQRGGGAATSGRQVPLPRVVRARLPPAALRVP